MSKTEFHKTHCVVALEILRYCIGLASDPLLDDGMKFSAEQEAAKVLKYKKRKRMIPPKTGHQLPLAWHFLQSKRGMATWPDVA